MKIAQDEYALNELNVIFIKSADQFDLAASLANDENLTALFRELSQERRRLSEALVEHIRTIGLPKFPDPEKEGLEHLATRFKTLFSRNEGHTLIHDQQTTEQEVARRLFAALQEQIPGSTRAFLEQTLFSLAKLQGKLADAKAQWS